MKWRIAVLVLCAAAAMSGCGGGSSSAGGAVAGTVVEISSATLDYERADTLSFGRVGSGEIVEKTLLLRNTDTVTWVVLDVYSVCGCLTADFRRSPVAPGGELPVTLRLDTAGYEGWMFKYLDINSSLSSVPHRIYVDAEVY